MPSVASEDGRYHYETEATMSMRSRISASWSQLVDKMSQMCSTCCQISIDVADVTQNNYSNQMSLKNHSCEVNYSNNVNASFKYCLSLEIYWEIRMPNKIRFKFTAPATYLHLAN